MKFLTKNPESAILKEGLTYKTGQAEKNRILGERLLAEQKNFCAYTERYRRKTDTIEVEHFNASLKDLGDDYFNYYAVIRWANSGKPDKDYVGSSFFTNPFFQDAKQWRQRVRYVDHEYEPINPADTEVREFIEFLRLNHSDLYFDRTTDANRVSKIFEDAGYSKEEKLNHFRIYPYDLSFITALEAELGMDLSSLIA